jgi:hypothetical protein
MTASPDFMFLMIILYPMTFISFGLGVLGFYFKSGNGKYDGGAPAID